MAWALRYAPHVGYVPEPGLMLPQSVLFRELAGPTRADHVRFAARQGMAGVLYPWAVDCPPAEREAVRAALQETRLACSCLVAAPLAHILDPIWVGSDAESAAKCERYIRGSIQIAKELGSQCLAILIRAEPQTSRSAQTQIAIDRLRHAADLAARHDLILAIEPMIALPDMLLRTFAEGVDLIHATAHPAVKLIFDTGHVFQMQEAVAETYIEAYDDIALLQLADMPGRVEPGLGTIDMVSIIAHAIQRGYQGLVDLEHGWLIPGKAAELEAIDRLAQIEAIATRLVRETTRADS